MKRVKKRKLCSSSVLYLIRGARRVCMFTFAHQSDKLDGREVDGPRARVLLSRLRFYVRKQLLTVNQSNRNDFLRFCEKILQNKVLVSF